MNSKKIFILPCSGEIVKYGTDTENKSVRTISDISNNLKIEVNSNINKKTIGLCMIFLDLHG